jgi:hypothetical protein
MHPALKHYDQVLADIKGQISRIKTEITPIAALEMGNEIQRHLNSVLADIAESMYIPEENRDWWEK